MRIYVSTLFQFGTVRLETHSRLVVTYDHYKVSGYNILYEWCIRWDAHELWMQEHHNLHTLIFIDSVCWCQFSCALSMELVRPKMRVHPTTTFASYPQPFTDTCKACFGSNRLFKVAHQLQNWPYATKILDHTSVMFPKAPELNSRVSNTSS